MSITKRKRNNKAFYVAEIYLNGKRFKSKSFENKSDAFFWHEKEKAEIERGLNKTKNPYVDFTFLEALEKYKKERLPKFKKSTRQGYEFRFNYFIKSPLAKFKMNEFSSHAVDVWLDWFLKHPTLKNPRRKSLLKEIKLLRSILQWWRDYIDADFNVPIVKRHREKCIYKPLKARRPDYYMKQEEILNWLEELKKGSNPVYWYLAHFMILTGARIGESCGLMWSEIDFEKKTAKIVRNVSWDYKTKDPYMSETTKTQESTRMIMLPQVLINKLTEWKFKSHSSSIVFCNKKGGLLKYNAVQESYNKAFKSLKLPWRSTHILRHSFATQALIVTRDLSAVQASLGHTDQQVTQKYAKTVALLESNTGEKVADFLKIK